MAKSQLWIPNSLTYLWIIRTLLSSWNREDNQWMFAEERKEQRKGGSKGRTEILDKWKETWLGWCTKWNRCHLNKWRQSMVDVRSDWTDTLCTWHHGHALVLMFHHPVTHSYTNCVAQNSCLCQYSKILKILDSYHIPSHRTASTFMVLWDSTSPHHLHFYGIYLSGILHQLRII